VREDGGPGRVPPAHPGRGPRRHVREAALLSKRALFPRSAPPTRSHARRVGEGSCSRAQPARHRPAGLWGRTTSLGVHVLAYPCPHPTSLRWRVTIECHAHRHKEAHPVTGAGEKDSMPDRSREDRVDGNRRGARAGHLLAAADHPKIHPGHRSPSKRRNLPRRKNSGQFPRRP